MKIGIIVGSLRKVSESGRVGEYLGGKIKNSGWAEVYLLDIGKEKIPFWDEDFPEKGDWKGKWEPISEELKSCDGYIIISPEYGGMASPAIKNFYLLCNKKELAHKPALLVGVSAARGGAYPISELRMSGYKNTYVCFLPDHLILRDVESLLVEDDSSENLKKPDKYIRERIDYSLNILKAYSTALIEVRKQDIFDYKKYSNGM
ncbi:MAG: NAD(P)H-dependent oxidoreductase [Leptospiraceae bacterium]|nr:NAD(P)H-dependent oxidoreductase [Leptospiraceae bacterium]